MLRNKIVSVSYNFCHPNKKLLLNTATAASINYNNNSSNSKLCASNFITRAWYSTESNEKYSYLKGEVFDDSISKYTVGHLLSKHARTVPFANAVRSTHQSASYTFSSMKKNVEALACGLVELGLRPGDRVVLVEGASVEQIFTQLACAKIGAIFTPFNSLKNSKDFTRLLEVLKPRVLISAQKVGKSNYLDILVNELLPELKEREELAEYVGPVKSKKFPFLKHVFFSNLISKTSNSYLLRDIMVYGPFGYYESPLRRIALTLSSNDPAVIIFNGDDVNKAWPVVYSQKNLLNAGIVLGQQLNITVDDRIMLPSYITKSFGSILGHFAAFVNGATLVYPTDVWDPAKTVKLIEEEQVTILFATAENVEDMLRNKAFAEYKNHSLKTLVIDSSATEEQIETFKDKFGVERVVTVTAPNEVIGVLMIDNKPIPQTELKITRKDGKIVHRDTFGELKVRGPIVPIGTWSDVGFVNLNQDDEGWVMTKKLAKIDEKGNLQFQ